MATELFVISPKVRIGWVGGAVRVGLAKSSAALQAPDLSLVTLLHQFATPRSVAEVTQAMGSGEAAQAIADLIEAGFLVEAPPPAAAVVEEAVTAESVAPPLDATVIMPTFNKAAYLDLTLSSYSTQRAENFEIIVIDDGGSDDAKAIAEQHKSEIPIRFMRCDHLGRAGARNVALRQARGDIVIFSDDDRLVGPDFIAAHVEAHRTADAPQVVLGWMYGIVSLLERKMLGPLFPTIARELAASGRKAEAGRIALLDATAIRERFNETVVQMATIEPDWDRKVSPAIAMFGEQLENFELGWFLGSTGNMSAPRSAIEALGGFDGGYTGYGMEDTDLCYGLCRAGARVRLCRDAVNFHQLHAKANLSAEITTTLRYFCRKHDNLDAFLFAEWFFNKLDLTQANQIAHQAKSEPDSAVLQALHASLRQSLSGFLHG